MTGAQIEWSGWSFRFNKSAMKLGRMNWKKIFQTRAMKHLLPFFIPLLSHPLAQNSFLTRSSPARSANSLCHPAAQRKQKWFILLRLVMFSRKFMKTFRSRDARGILAVLRQSYFFLICDQITEFKMKSDKLTSFKEVSSSTRLQNIVLHDPNSISFIQNRFGWFYSQIPPPTMYRHSSVLT